MTEPPIAKYRYTLVVTGNSHDEIERELLVMTRGGYLLDSEYGARLMAKKAHPLDTEETQ